MKEKENYIFFDKDTAFQGEISTDNLVLEGVVTGEIHASNEVFLKQGSIVQGEIAARKYLVEEGSVHQGKLKMDREKAIPHSPSNNGGNGAINLKEAASYPDLPAEFQITVSEEESNQSTSDNSSGRRLW